MSKTFVRKWYKKSRDEPNNYEPTIRWITFMKFSMLVRRTKRMFSVSGQFWRELRERCAFDHCQICGLQCFQVIFQACTMISLLSLQCVCVSSTETITEKKVDGFFLTSCCLPFMLGVRRTLPNIGSRRHCPESACVVHRWLHWTSTTESKRWGVCINIYILTNNIKTYEMLLIW